MEKIININFQGRIIPIEDTAYNSLKQYIDGLRGHFASEESSDEIINDIENRIAELFSDRLKRGANCINSNDLKAVIDSIGRLEDIEAAEGDEGKAPKGSYNQPESAPGVKGRFFRNSDDKVIAGVCSGIANRMRADPAIVRVVFVLLFGALFWIYILLWIVVPSQSIHTNITRRLYRNPDDKVIAGVCGGLAVYFRVESWIPRLIFVLPLFIGILSRGIFAFWWHWHWGLGPSIFMGSFGSTLFILYVILWIALPYASSAADRLEMRGEKVDINAIKAAAQAKAGAGALSARHSGNGIGHVIGILFKAFFLFLAGVFALSLFGVLIGLVFAGSVATPFTDFFLDDWRQSMLLWCGIVLCLCIPLLALITWIVRRLTGARSHRHYLGYVFAGLWLVGVVSIVALAGVFIRNFGSRATVEEAYPLHQPSINKLYTNINKSEGQELYMPHSGYFENWDNKGVPYFGINKDSLWLNTVKVNVVQSADSLYHIYESKTSRGITSEDARNLADHISFPIKQQDSIVNLPVGFAISKKDKFRNQQVLIMVEVPVGKEIQFDKHMNAYTWFNIHINRRRNIFTEHSWGNGYQYRNGREYMMTSSGLKTKGLAATTDSDGDSDNDDN